MNLPSIVILILILSAVAYAVYRQVRRRRHHHDGCAGCDVEDCALRDILQQSKNKNQKCGR